LQNKSDFSYMGFAYGTANKNITLSAEQGVGINFSSVK
jgi:hypothetical protein